MVLALAALQCCNGQGGGRDDGSDEGAPDPLPDRDEAVPDGTDEGPAETPEERTDDGGEEPAAACGDGDGYCPDGCPYYRDADCPMCDPSIGLTSPLPVCSEDFPCRDLLVTYTRQGITEIARAADAAVCVTGTAGTEAGRPSYDDGPPRVWADDDGTARTWCEFRPPGTAPDSQRPLVIFVHGSGGTAATVYDYTSLRSRAPDYDLSGDPAHPGFILVSSQGRYLHWPTSSAQDGSKHDTYHRDLGVPSANRDIAFFDAVIDELADEGVIDESRIYVVGWSNGARYAALYGIARHATATAGGHNVAAVAVYSGGDPFENTTDDQVPSCRQDPYPATELPYLLVSRTCDEIACNEAQAQALRDGGVDVTPGNVAETWIEALRTLSGDPNVEWSRLTYEAQHVNLCAPVDLCTPMIALLNHLHWPDGIDDGSGLDHENDLLDFLRDNPLAP